MGVFSKKKQTVGYMYYLGIHLILGYANADGMKQIWVGEKVVWPTPNRPNIEAADASSNDETKLISAASIFGGTGVGQEGGIAGYVDIQYGASDQGRNSYLVARLGQYISAFRGLLSVVLKQVYIGTSAYPKPWSFLIKRTNKLVSGGIQWYSAKAVIRSGQLDGDDLNAIHIIRECLIDKEFGLGFSVNDINDVNFKACADVCYNEGLGLSIIWDNNTPVEDFIDSLLEVIAGSLYQNLSTGKWELALIREDYIVGDLEAFNEDQIIEIEEFNRSGYGEVTDQITVNWHDKIYCKNRSLTISDHVMIEKQGGKIIETTYNYHSICNKELANEIASRELQLVTSMLASMRIKCNRQMSHLKPNDVFKLSWNNLGITNMVIRILEANYGNITKNEIVFECCEDVFGTAYTVIEDPPDTEWTDPVSDPADTVDRFLMEVPYWHLCNYCIEQDFVDVLDNDAALMFALAAKPAASPDSCEFDLLVKFSPSYEFDDEGDGSFIPIATLKNNLVIMGSESDWIELENVQDLDLVSVDTYAIIEDSVDDEKSEIVRILEVDITEGVERIRIARGILDTKPSTHLIGDRLWFVSFTDFTVPVVSKDFINGGSPRAKFLTKTANGILAEGSATEENTTPTYLAFNSRMIRPYLPGNLKINGVRFPEYLYGQPTLTWNHRDRTDSDQLRSLVKHTDATDYGPVEAGTTYTLKIYNQDDYLLRTVNGLESAVTYTYSQGDEEADSPDGHVSHKLRFVFYATRDGYDSWQEYDIMVERPLYGTIDAVASVTGALFVDPRKLKGNSSSAVTITGSLAGIQKIAGLIAGECGAAPGTDGSLTVNPTVLAGSVIVGSTTAGNITVT